MGRDVERDCSVEEFVSTLRRIADALEQEDSFRIQVRGLRFTVPSSAELSIEHEADDGAEELELQLKWQSKDDD
jgi:amphi-Trp domain-containing protein